MIQIAFFDIDGTLYDEKNKCYPQSAVDALRRLHSNGVLIAAATGRPPFTAETLRQAGIPLDYLVCSNGHILLSGTGEVLASSTFSPELAGQVWDYCRENKIGLLFKYPDCTYVYRDDPEFDAIFSKNPRTAAHVYRGDQTAHLTRSPNGGCLACGTEALAEFNRHFQGLCRAVDINGRSSDLMLWGVNKGTGVKRLLEKLGIPPENAIAFGDNRNDLEVIRCVGIGVAMGNGEDTLKEASSYVTACVDQDGIQKGLAHFGLI